MRFILFAVGLGLAALALAATAAAPAHATNPPMTLCSGPDGGMYQRAAQEVVNQGRDRLQFNLVPTKGSIENLDKLAAGECDAAPVQADAFRVYKAKYSKDAGALEKAGPLYLEYVHLICNNKAGVSRIVDLRNGKHGVAIGPERSGSSVTWDSFVLADKSYSKTPTLPLAGARALEKVKLGDEAACMIFTSALNNNFVKTDVNAAGDYVSLIPADDGDFDNAKDDKGQPIYRYMAIPGGTYPKIQHGTLGTSVKTVAVEAIWVVRSDWIDKNERPYNYFIAAKNKAAAAIRQLVGQ